MKPKFKSVLFLCLATVSIPFAMPSASASVIYWDPASSGTFGTINNTTSWVPSLNIVWTGSNTGATSRLANYTTTLSDDCNWGGPTAALGGGTVPVGTVNAKTLSFNTISGTGSVILSGGTITLASTTSITALNSNTHTISSTLAGAATSLTKLGTGTVILSGSNTYTGATIVSAGTLNIGSAALSNSPLNTTSSIAGTSTAGLKTTATSLTFGGLTGTQDLASLFTTTSGGYGLVSSLTLNPGASVTNTYSGVIADGAPGMSLTKSGSGTQVLSGANTYTGSTTLNSGTLKLDYSTQDNSKLADGAALVLGGGTLELSGGTHTEVVASTTLTGAVNVTRSSGSAKIALGAISGTGTINFSEDNIATTTNANNSEGILGGYATVGGTSFAANDGFGNIIAYNGYTLVDARGPSTIADNASANVRIFGDGTSGNIELGATITTVSSLSQSNVNFAAVVNTAGKTLVTNNVSIITGAESLTIGASAGDGVLMPAASGGTLVLNNVNAAKVLTINAAIPDNTSASSLTKVGSGSVVMAGANTYTGTTLVGSGTLSLTGSLTNSPVSVSGDAVLSESSTGSISGDVALTLSSSGSSTLAGNNSYTGVTSISSGLLNIQSATALGTVDAGTTVANGAALQIQGGIVVGAEALSLTGNGVATTGALRSISGANTWGGPITLGGSTRIQCDADSLTLDVPSGNAISGSYSLVFGGNGNITIADPIATGANTVTKEGTGTLTLKVANSFSNGVVVTSGVLNIQNATAIGTGSVGVTVSSAAALQMQGDIVVGNQPLFLQGTGISNTGALRNLSGNNTWGGLISLAATTRINSDSGTLTIDVPSGNAIGGTGVAVPSPPVIFGGSGNITVADPISISAGTLTKDGTGTLTLTASNVYTGTTTIANGTLNAKSSNSIGDGSATNTLIFTGGTLQAGGNITSPATRSVTLTSTGQIDTNGNSVSIGGNMGGTGGLTKNGSGTLTLSGSNTYSGATSVNNGTLALVGGSQSSPITVGSGASLGFTLGSPTTSTSTVDLSAGTVAINGTPTLASYTLITSSAGITGTPTLSTPISGYQLQVSGNALNLVQTATPYSLWAAAKGLDNSDAAHASASNADPDGDGHNNLYEFGFDGDPLSAAFDGKIVGKIATVGPDQVFTLTLPVRNGATFSTDSGDLLSAQVDGIYYRIEGCGDLATFADTISEVTGTDAITIQTGLPTLSSGWTYRTFRVSGTVASTLKDFMRATVSETP